MFWGLLLVTFVLCMFIQRWKRRKMMKLFEKYRNNDINVPLIGHIYKVFGKNTDEGRMRLAINIAEESYKNGGMVAFWLANKLVLGVSNPKIAESVLKNSLEKDDSVVCCRSVTGNGSIFAPVSIWRSRRKVVAPTFKLKNVNGFVKTFAEQSEIMVNRLKDVKNGPFSIWDYFTTYSMDAACETTLDVKVNAQLQPNLLPFLRSFEEITRLTADRLCQPLFHNNTVYSWIPVYKKFSSAMKVIRDFIDEIIESKKKSMELLTEEITKITKHDSKDEKKSFLELMIESSESVGGFGNVELSEESLVMVVAGTDTSAVAASFTTLMLASYPEVQDRCYEELQEVFGESDRPVTVENLPHLKYLDAVIRETLRLYPPVPFISRKSDKKYVLPTGDLMVPGCRIIISIFAIHRNPEYWGEDADKFRPERFLHSELKHPAAFLPFSVGPRACLGAQYSMMSIKTVVASLLRHYRLHPASSASRGNQDLKLKYNVMLRHADNFQLQVERRNK